MVTLLHFFTLFFCIFFNPPEHPKFQVGLEKLGFEHTFQPYTYSLRPFSQGAWGLNENRWSLENISTFPLATASKSSVKQTTLTSKTKNLLK